MFTVLAGFLESVLCKVSQVEPKTLEEDDADIVDLEPNSNRTPS